MKRIFIFLVLLGLSASLAYAQFPVSDASCAYCGVKLSKNGKPIENVQHKKGCKYYVEEEPESSTPQSTHLKDYTPKEESKNKDPKPTFLKVEKVPQPKQPSQPQSQTSSGQHLSSVNIKNEYDKKLTDKFGNTAYCKTFPNGLELWAIFHYSGTKIGEFAGVELLGDGESLYYLKVKGTNGLYGLYYSKEQKLGINYTDIKPIIRTTRNGQKFVDFDVSQRGSDGLQKHGLFDGRKFTLPCEYDRIEALNTNTGYYVKITKNGLMGVANGYDGTIIVPAKYTYLNTYYTPSKTLYFIVGIGDKLGACSTNEWKKEPVIPLEYTLDQVRSMLNKKD